MSAPKVNETDADAMIARTKALVFQTLLRVGFIVAAKKDFMSTMWRTLVVRE